MDSVLSEGVLRELPIVGTMVKLAKTRQRIAEELFLRKLLRFLCELRSVSAEERAELLAKYPDGSEQQRDLGENLLLALDRLDAVQNQRCWLASSRHSFEGRSTIRCSRALPKHWNASILL